MLSAPAGPAVIAGQDGEQVPLSSPPTCPPFSAVESTLAKAVATFGPLSAYDSCHISRSVLQLVSWPDPFCADVCCHLPAPPQARAEWLVSLSLAGEFGIRAPPSAVSGYGLLFEDDRDCALHWALVLNVLAKAVDVVVMNPALAAESGCCELPELPRMTTVVFRLRRAAGDSGVQIGLVAEQFSAPRIRRGQRWDWAGYLAQVMDSGGNRKTCVPSVLSSERTSSARLGMNTLGWLCMRRCMRDGGLLTHQHGLRTLPLPLDASH